MIIGLVGAAFAAERLSLVVRELIYIISPAVIFIAVFGVTKRASRLDKLVTVLIYYGLVSALIQVFLWFIFYDADVGRFQYRWRYLLMSSSVWPVCMLVAFQRIMSQGFSFGRFIYIVVLSACALASMGRLDLTLLLAFFVLFALPRKLYKAYAYSLLAAIPVVVIFLSSGSSLISDDSSVDWRLVEWVSYFSIDKTVWQIFWGFGFGSELQTIVPLTTYYDGKTYNFIARFHSIFLYLLFKTGVVGFGAFCFFLWSLIKPYRDNLVARSRNMGLQLLMVYLVLGGSFFGLYTMSFVQSAVIALLLILSQSAAQRSDV
jgi:hypothetical protein